SSNRTIADMGDSSLGRDVLLSQTNLLQLSKGRLKDRRGMMMLGIDGLGTLGGDGGLDSDRRLLVLLVGLRGCAAVLSGEVALFGRVGSAFGEGEGVGEHVGLLLVHICIHGLLNFVLSEVVLGPGLALLGPVLGLHAVLLGGSLDNRVGGAFGAVGGN